MMFTVIFSLFIILAYLIGSLSAAIITCKAMGLEDPRNGGSKNPGTTNVLRIGGKKPAIITLIGDMLKGTLPVLIASLYITDIQLLGFIALAAFLGHLYPVFFNFSGGKGVATFLGALLGIDIWLFLFAIICWLATAAISRISSLSALLASILTVLFCLYHYGPHFLTLSILIMALFLIYKHQANIKRLFNGTEPKIGKK